MCNEGAGAVSIHDEGAAGATDVAVGLLQCGTDQVFTSGSPAEPTPYNGAGTHEATNADFVNGDPTTCTVSHVGVTTTYAIAKCFKAS